MNLVIKDPYSLESRGDQFGDYYNEIILIVMGINSGLPDEKIVEMLHENPLREVEVRFSEYYERYPKTKEGVDNHPVKVAHINHMVKLANTCTTIVFLKPVLNEISRLIYGKEKALLFPEKEFDPDLVSLKE